MSSPQSRDGWVELFEAYATGSRTPGYATPEEAITGAFGAVAVINEGNDAEARSMVQSPEVMSRKSEFLRMLGLLIRGCEAIKEVPRLRLQLERGRWRAGGAGGNP
jgi:hypothetical protein